jgi:hypothetical protein
MKGSNIVIVNIVPIFNRGLPKAMPINMHFGFESNMFGKISTPENAEKIRRHPK